MTFNNRKEAESFALSCNKLSNAPWLVVDTDGHPKAQYRVWSEQTITEQDPQIHYELISRAMHGTITQIA